MKSSYNYCNYVVTFIDVLGQKNEFKGINSIPADEESEKKLKMAHKETVIFIETFRKCFSDIFKTYIEDKKPKVKVPEDKKEKFNELRRVVLKHKRFSDSIQAFVPLETEKFHLNAVNGVFGILAACGGMMLITLSQGKAFRAGIDLGLGTELSNGEVYGPALFKAYELEDNVAEYPRIVIGDDFIGYLGSLLQKQKQCDDQDEEDIEACQKMASICRNMIVTDLDGRWILDYLGKEFREKVLDKMQMFEEAFENAFKFVESEFVRRQRKRDSKLAKRYFLLYTYFKARRAEITSEN